ncbi:MAG TPA: gluconokinase [Naasia sp.]|jgi:carbohydrate kinase (thermoresistant glucokinase family)
MTPIAIVVMGVSGSGKSTVGRLIAEKLDVDFVDADDLHSAESTAKMAAGTPLTDEDRWPWLRRVGAVLAEETGEGKFSVVACSALRRAYRDLLRDAAGGPVAFVHLHGTRELLEQRLGEREGHFMPPALLDSQLSTLEPLQDDERSVLVDIALPPEQAAEVALAALTAE